MFLNISMNSVLKWNVDRNALFAYTKLSTNTFPI